MPDPSELLADPFDVSGRNAIVTGAARGIGHAIAAQFLQAGANVVVCDIDRDGLKRAVDRLGHHPGRVVPFEIDVSDRGQIDALVSHTVETLGSVDILVNNAAIGPPTPLDDLDPEVVDRLFEVNVKGLLYLSAACAAVMAPGSAIVHISSLGAKRSPFVGMSVYHATKGALDVLTRDMAMEWGPKGIRVNGVAPGGVTTEGNVQVNESPLMPRELLDDAKARALARPLGRMAYPTDLAPVVVFLASPAARFVTGQRLIVDGGYYFT